MKKVIVEKCSVKKPHSRWYEGRIDEEFSVTNEVDEFYVVYDDKNNFNRRILKSDTKIMS